MKVYSFKCNNCGSQKYKKIDDHTYQCEYCDSVEEVHLSEDTKEPDSTLNAEQENENIMQENLEEFKRKINKSALIDFLIILLFGFWGVHRFIKGKIITGLLFLFTGGLFWIGYLCDLAKSAVKLFKEDNSEKNR